MLGLWDSNNTLMPLTSNKGWDANLPPNMAKSQPTDPLVLHDPDYMALRINADTNLATINHIPIAMAPTGHHLWEEGWEMAILLNTGNTVTAVCSVFVKCVFV